MNMKRFLFSLLALFAMGSGLQAQITVTDLDGAIAVDDVEILPGEEATITFKLTKLPEDGLLRALQFDLYLPNQGFKLKTNKKGAILYEISEDQMEEDQEFSVTGSFMDNYQHIRFIMKSDFMPNPNLGQEHDYLAIGDLFSVTLVAESTVASQQYQALVAGGTQTAKINLSGKNGSTTYVQTPFTFNINMPLVYDEMENYAIGDFAPGQNLTVTMKRSLNAGKWNTICLPFNMSNDKMKAVFGENVKLAEFTGCEKTVNGDNTHLSLSFTSMSLPEITANTPYLINSANSISYDDGFTLTGVSLTEIENEPAVTANECTFHGNYAVEDHLDKALYISNETFKVAVGNTRVKAFRGYFTHPALDESSANVSIFVDDEPTGIRGINADQDNDDIYDISGRKVNSDKTTLQKGVYIINGKKETVH